MKVAKSDAVEHSRKGVIARYYQMPQVDGGTTVAYAEFRGEHGLRVSAEQSRIYYILEGSVEFEINGEKFSATKDDVVAIPPHSTYNLWPKGEVVKVVLFMELLDISKLPK